MSKPEKKKEHVEVPIIRDGDGQVLGLWLGGWFVKWGREYSLAKIHQERLEKGIQTAINVGIFLIGFSGLIWLIWILFQVYLSDEYLRDWILKPHAELRYFWWSAIASMYIAYRIVKESIVESKVLKPEDVPEAIMPSEEAISSLHKKAHIDMSQSLDANAERVIQKAWMIARQLKHEEVTPLHLFSAALILGEANLILARLAVNVQSLVKQIQKQFIKGESPHRPQFSQESLAVFLTAYFEAFYYREPQVSSMHLFIALVRSEGVAKEIFRENGIDEKRIRHVSEWLQFHKNFISRAGKFRKASQFKPKGEMNRSYTSVVTPFLDQFSTDMTSIARSGGYDPIVNRLKEFEMIFRQFESGHRGVLLVGDRGVGRTAIMEGIARRMASEDVPGVLLDKRLVSVSVSALVAGASQFGSAEQRLLGVLGEAQRSGNIVLLFDNIQELVGVGTETSVTFDLSQVLADALEKSGLIAFATTTPSDWVNHVERSGMGRVFERIDIDELDYDTSLRVLESKAPYIETTSGALFSYPALESVIQLTDRYMHEERLPHKAIRIMEELGHVVANSKGKGAIITEEDVATVISDKTKIPVSDVTSDESKKLLELEDMMHERVVAQDEAVKVIAAAMRRARTSLREEKRPIVNLLFLGPTGVGKTEVAKTLAEVYFGDEDSMIRFDMSEYQHEGSVYRLIGGGGNETGLLTEAVRRRPFALLLLDEVEKAHPNILNLFLQVLDDGRLTDSAGLTVDFTNTIIIATSNAGAFYIQDAVKRGDSVEQIRVDLLERELRQFFRPEWLNRMDNIVVFKPLTMSNVVTITRLMLNKIVKKLEAKEIGFVISDEIVQKLAEDGYSAEYGARPLRREIQDKIEDALSRIMLENKVGRRDVIYVEGDFEWRVEKGKTL